MQVAAPLINNKICVRATHFFPAPKCGVLLDASTGLVSPDPTKLMPKLVKKKNGVQRYELSVILHEKETDVRWQDGGRIYTVSGKAYGGIDFPYDAGAAVDLYVEAEDSTISDFHGNVLGWQDDEDVQQAQAIGLASNAVVKINPACERRFIDYKKLRLLEYKQKSKITICTSNK